MAMSRRRALALIAVAPAFVLSREMQTLRGSASLMPAQGAKVKLEIAPGPFKDTRESLREWQIPE
jgi:hypothetical protein